MERSARRYQPLRQSRRGAPSLLLDGVGAGETAADDAKAGGLPGGIVPLEEVEQEMVRRAMEAADNNQTRAAELLGISRDQLRYRLKKLAEE